METLDIINDLRRVIPAIGSASTAAFPLAITVQPIAPTPPPPKRAPEEHFAYMLGRLKSWITAHGADTHPSLKSDDKDLRAWMNTCRSLYKRGKLRQDRIDRLSEIGFKFEASGFHLQREDAYQTALQHIGSLQVYYLTYGHMDVPVRCKEYPGLGKWCSDLRQVAKKCPDDQRVLLVKETCKQFKWKIDNQFNDPGVREAVWWKNHDATASFVRTNKRLPQHVQHTARTDEEQHLGVWLMHQRAAYNGRGAVKLNDTQRKAIGVILNSALDWVYIGKLVAFVAADDRLPSSASRRPDERRLASWLDICENEGGAHLLPAQRAALRRILTQYGINTI
jgi:hypothetical protein